MNKLFSCLLFGTSEFSILDKMLHLGHLYPTSKYLGTSCDFTADETSCMAAGIFGCLSPTRRTQTEFLAITWTVVSLLEMSQWMRKRKQSKNEDLCRSLEGTHRKQVVKFKKHALNAYYAGTVPGPERTRQIRHRCSLFSLAFKSVQDSVA